MTFLPYGHQSISEEDIQAVTAVLRGDWLSQGPAVDAFEEAVAEYAGVDYAVAFCNGTAALHGAIHAAGVHEGSRALTTPLTFAASSNAALYCGARPLFADISEQTLCLDPVLAEKVLEEGPVSAITPVSFAGYPVDIVAFRRLCEKTGAVLIEDGCHALGGKRGDRKIGFEADMTVFSFHPVKHITTGEGGMVVTRSKEYAEKMRRFRSHGIVKNPSEFVRPYAGPWDTDMLELGYNYRLTDIASALGLSQMKRLDSFIVRRREIASRYRELLCGMEGVTLPPGHDGHAYHLFCIRVGSAVRKAVFQSLREAGIGVQLHYVPVHLHTYYREVYGFVPGQFPLAEAFAAEAFSLPIFPDMWDEDIERVVAELKKALERHS